VCGNGEFLLLEISDVRFGYEGEKMADMNSTLIKMEGVKKSF